MLGDGNEQSDAVSEQASGPGARVLLGAIGGAYGAAAMSVLPSGCTARG